MAAWRGRVYQCMGMPLEQAISDDVLAIQWDSNRVYEERSGLMYLGTEGRRHVEGGAPYLYEARQGKPQYPPDEYDTPLTYPM